jgi:hypothetical protein
VRKGFTKRDHWNVTKMMSMYGTIDPEFAARLEKLPGLKSNIPLEHQALILHLVKTDATMYADEIRESGMMVLPLFVVFCYFVSNNSRCNYVLSSYCHGRLLPRVVYWPLYPCRGLHVEKGPVRCQAAKLGARCGVSCPTSGCVLIARTHGARDVVSFSV